MITKTKKRVRYSGIQPQYFPRLHYFARILNADIFVLRDDAQYVRKHKYPNGLTDKSYQAHSPIKQALGRQLLSVPTQHEGLAPLTRTKVFYEQTWTQDHLKALQIAYAHAPFFKDLYPQLERLLQTHYLTLADLNIATIVWGILRLLEEKSITKDKLTLPFINKKLRGKPPFRLKKIARASESRALRNTNLSTNEKIVALCREFGANEDYCGGTGVAAYVEHDLFEKNGITVTVQDWKCGQYHQQFQKRMGFIPNLSILDLLFNVSTKNARAILS